MNKGFMTIPFIAYTLSALLLIAGCAPIQDAGLIHAIDESSTNNFIPVTENEYRIQVGDVLAIRSYYDSQLNQEVFVRPDGRISLLLMDDVDVVGMTPVELDRLVTSSYSKLVESPEITVVIKESSDMGFYVGGEVMTESVFPMKRQVTLLQGISMAGGFLDTADRMHVLLLRRQDDGKFINYKIDTNKILTNEKPDIYVRRSDMIYIPRSRIANVNLFVDQYINQIIPRSVLFNFGWFRNKNTNPQDVKIVP